MYGLEGVEPAASGCDEAWMLNAEGEQETKKQNRYPRQDICHQDEQRSKNKTIIPGRKLTSLKKGQRSKTIILGRKFATGV